jgi:D-alanine-D-alanine ligase
MEDWMSEGAGITSERLPVIVLFNQASPSTRKEDQAAELGVLDSVGATVTALTRAGFSVETFGLGDDIEPLMRRLREGQAVVVNYCEAFRGNSKGESFIAGVLELMGVPYTGSPPAALALCLDKIRTKRVLAGAGLPTPAFLEFTPDHERLADDELAARLSERGIAWPAIVKAACEDASHGLDQRSVCQSIADVRAAARRIVENYGYPALIEQFIDGREFNACVVDDPEPRSLPIEEVKFDRNGTFWPIVTYDSKWKEGSEEDLAAVALCPTELDAATEAEITRLALEAVRLTGCRDYTRVDLRLTPDGRPYILEVNSNPDLGPDAGVAFQLAAAGIKLDDFIVRLVEHAARRRPIARPTEQPAIVDTASLNGLVLRSLEPADREPIRAMLGHCGNFRPEELDIAVELIDETLADASATDYQFVVAAEHGRVVGYSCFGQTPAADGVWDLYWIAVDPSARGQGIAHQLQAATEKHIRNRGGRLVLAETSSLPNYADARAFYLREGFQLVDRLADYYRPGDDRLTFGKRL